MKKIIAFLFLFQLSFGQINPEEVVTAENEFETNFFDALKEKAIENYDLTIKTNYKENEYLAANSCLQLGFIYQKLKFNQLAKTFFNKVFDYKNYDYKNYLQQQAKAAISKLEKS